MIVVDLGCYDPPGGYDSLKILREAFAPELLFGFDPQAVARDEMTAGTRLVVEAKAAWIADGSVRFERGDTESCISFATRNSVVPCFDFSMWLARLGQNVTVKMDVEGAEYALLTKMRGDGTLQQVDKLLIEWHGDPIETGVPTEPWWN